MRVEGGQNACDAIMFFEVNHMKNQKTKVLIGSARRRRRRRRKRRREEEEGREKEWKEGMVIKERKGKQKEKQKSLMNGRERERNTR